MPIPRGKPGAAEQRSDFARYAGLGVQFGAAVVLFTLGGAALDRWAGTSPLFLLVGVALGFTGGLISLIRQVPRVRSGRTPGTRPPVEREPPNP
ncbi:MAG TPA: AtpZ/AtpI family protein [Planctomycetota bacterium]|nr:AtpZ/AtpI family protein [Planctomycetota bacterium]